MKKQFLILPFCTFFQILLSMEGPKLEKIYSLQECCLRAIATNYVPEFNRHMSELQELITSFPTANFKEKLLELLDAIINKGISRGLPCPITTFPLATKLTWLKFYCSKKLLAYVGSVAYFKDNMALITENNASFYFSHTIPFFFDAPIQCAVASILHERSILVFAQDKSLLVRDEKTECIDCSESAITSLTFSPNLIIGYGNENGQIQLLGMDLQGFWKKIKTMAFNKAKITSLAISPCTHYIVACDEEGTALFYGNAAYTNLDQYSYCLGKETPTEYCLISPNGLLIALQQQNSTILLCNLLRLMRGVYPYYFIADKKLLTIGKLLSFTPDNKLIVEKDNKLTLYNENGNALEEELSLPHDVIEFSATPFHCRTQNATYIPEYTQP